MDLTRRRWYCLALGRYMHKHSHNSFIYLPSHSRSRAAACSGGGGDDLLLLLLLLLLLPAACCSLLPLLRTDMYYMTSAHMPSALMPSAHKTSAHHRGCERLTRDRLRAAAASAAAAAAASVAAAAAARGCCVSESIQGQDHQMLAQSSVQQQIAKCAKASDASTGRMDVASGSRLPSWRARGAWEWVVGHALWWRSEPREHAMGRRGADSAGMRGRSPRLRGRVGVARPAGLCARGARGVRVSVRAARRSFRQTPQRVPPWECPPSFLDEPVN